MRYSSVMTSCWRAIRLALWASSAPLVVLVGCDLRRDGGGVTEASEDTLPPPMAAPTETAKVLYPDIPEHRLNPLGSVQPPKREPPRPTRAQLATLRCKTQTSGAACKSCCRVAGIGSVYMPDRGCQCI